jgi:hypothetical protein
VDERATRPGIEADRRLLERPRAEAQLRTRAERTRRLQFQHARAAGRAVTGGQGGHRSIAADIERQAACEDSLRGRRLAPRIGNSGGGDIRQQCTRQQRRFTVELRHAEHDFGGAGAQPIEHAPRGPCYDLRGRPGDVPA